MSAVLVLLALGNILRWRLSSWHWQRLGYNNPLITRTHDPSSHQFANYNLYGNDS